MYYAQLPPEQVQFVISQGPSVFRSEIEVLARICVGWLLRTNLLEKRLLIYERTRELDPDRYEIDKEKIPGARWLHCVTAEGAIIEPSSYEVFEKGFSTIALEMLPDNWGDFSYKTFERILVHELLHVSNPTTALIIDLGGIREDYAEMWRLTDQRIAMLGSLVRH
jgi:hypothetical protein